MGGRDFGHIQPEMSICNVKVRDDAGALIFVQTFMRNIAVVFLGAAKSQRQCRNSIECMFVDSAIAVEHVEQSNRMCPTIQSSSSEL